MCLFPAAQMSIILAFFNVRLPQILKDFLNMMRFSESLLALLQLFCESQTHLCLLSSVRCAARAIHSQHQQ
jgi:hypothetical protein